MSPSTRPGANGQDLLTGLAEQQVPGGIRVSGLSEDSRPVAATAWLKLVWIRPVSGLTISGKLST